jgi:hypothetical protein
LSAELQQVAHSYIKRGWAVLLLSTDGTGGKVPPSNCSECNWKLPSYKKHTASECDHLLCHGFYAATHDVGRFDQMLAALPHGQLAIRTGRESRILVIDAEAHSKNENEPTGIEVLDDWKSWINGEWELPATLTSRSVSGGVHLYYSIGPDVEIGSGRILPNVDVKSEYGYVGAPSGKTARSWIDLAVPVAAAPPELLKWLQETKRMSASAGVGAGAGMKPDGYDFVKFREHCPDGYRDFFFNDLAFRLRKNRTQRDVYEDEIHQAWQRCAQPPDATYEMPWDHVYYKLERVWMTIDPDPPSKALSWAQSVMDEVAEKLATAANLSGNDDSGLPAGSGDGGDDGVRLSPMSVGELEPPDRWYGTNDDGTAERMFTVWGDWFRAIPRQRGGYAWIQYTGVTWETDTRDRIWDAMGHLVSLLPRELDRWQARCLALDNEGVQDWRTRRVGGNGVNADEFEILVALRKYVSACKENARKETGVKAFARRPEITISEDDLDAQTRFVGLCDGRALDVEAVHDGENKDDWLLPASPDMLLTKQLGCGYVAANNDIPSTVFALSSFSKYLKDVLPDKAVRDTLQEIVGYALLGRPTEKIILLLHGPPDSGKTVLLEVLEALFGDYSDWTDGQALIAGKAKSAHSEWLNNIRGLRLVVTPETAKGAKIDAAWMKSYTGREPQTSRGAYGDRTVTWLPSGIIVNASNHYIEYDAEDTAVAERTQVIEFEEQFLRGDPRRDDTLPMRIKTQELPIVLNWALEGLRRHGTRTAVDGNGVTVRAPQLKIADKISEWSKRYQVAQDHVGQFLSDAQEEGKLCETKVVVDPDGLTTELPASAFILAKVMYALYKSWCVAQEIKKPFGRNTFNSHLKNVYHMADVVSAGKRWHGWVSPITDDLRAEMTRW